MSTQGTACFVRRDINEPLKPFSSQGINVCHTEEKPITARRIEIGYHGMKAQGFTATSLSHCLHGYTEDDDQLRQSLSRFWRSKEGKAIVEARFGSSTLEVFPTHVTRRQAPPDHLNLVHIDYPSSYNLKTLYQEWSNRWESLLPSTFADSYQLRGVLTVWIALSQVSNYPLLIADASTVSDTVIYKVGKRSSVGVYYDGNIQWYTVPEMEAYDAWIFDTQANPHVAVDFHSEGSRASAEVRCLVVCRT